MGKAHTSRTHDSSQQHGVAWRVNCSRGRAPLRTTQLASEEAAILGRHVLKGAGRSGGRKGDRATHARIVALREAGKSIAKTAELADCDRSTVKRVWAAHRAAQVQEPSPQRNHRERNR